MSALIGYGGPADLRTEDPRPNTAPGDDVKRAARRMVLKHCGTESADVLDMIGVLS